MTLRAAAEQALDTLEHVQAHIGRYDPPVVTTIARAMQPTIDALRAALAAEQPQPEALGYATRLATSLWEKHYKAVSPHWRPLNDTLGVLTQIDNMTCRLVPPPPAAEPTDEQSPPEAQPVAWMLRSVRGDAFHAGSTPPQPVDVFPWVPLYAAPPQPAATPCPHIRSSGTGEWATHWCSLNGPPAAGPSEASDAEVEAAFIALHGAPSDYMFTAAMRVDAKARVRDALRAAAAARTKC